MPNRSDIKSLYKFAADSSFHGSDSQDQGLIFHGIHELLKIAVLKENFNAKHAPIELNKGKYPHVQEFATRAASKYGFELNHYHQLRTPVPSESQFLATHLPFDSISKEWALRLAEVSVALVQEIRQRFAKAQLSEHEDDYFIQETTSTGLEDTLTEIIKTTAQMFAWAGLSHDYQYTLEILHRAINTVDNPTLNNPVSVYSAMSNTGFGLLVPLIDCGYLTPDIFVYADNGEVTIHPGIRGMLNDWKQKGARAERYTGGCLWRFREYTKPDGTKYKLDYSMIDMAALVLLKFLKMPVSNLDES